MEGQFNGKKEACDALKNLAAITAAKKQIEVLIENKIVILRRLKSGGSKTIYDIGNGDVIVLKNIDTDFINENTANAANAWINIVATEKKMADKLKKLGLRSQDFEIIMIYIGGSRIPVLKMPSFSKLNSIGKQVKDWKNEKDRFGQSMFLGSLENITNHHYLKELSKHVIQDIITLVANGLQFNDDSVNLIIEDTHDTPSNNPLGTITELHQQIRLFFHDFTTKDGFVNAGSFVVTNKNGDLNWTMIEKWIKKYFNKYISLILVSISDSEFRKLGVNIPESETSIDEELFTETKKTALSLKLASSLDKLILNSDLDEIKLKIAERVMAENKEIPQEVKEDSSADNDYSSRKMGW